MTKKKKEKAHTVYKTRQEALDNVEDYIKKACPCFVWRVKGGWAQIFGSACAHYVAYEKNIKFGGFHKCYEKHPFRVPKVISGLQKRTGPDRLHKVREEDIWAKKYSSGDEHCGFVSEYIDIAGKTPTIKITHLSSKDKIVEEDTYGSGIIGGDFYGPPLPLVQYYVNMNAQANGDHEVHKLGCSWMPNPENRKYLGRSTICHSAVRKAKEHYSQSNGCYYCSNACHTQ